MREGEGIEIVQWATFRDTTENRRRPNININNFGQCLYPLSMLLTVLCD